ncbi:hypothetical protein SLEP1_g27265 [Rubroshorea leprosula]|uniref:Uncharacterized protein n=1 Tax=Rubroshorea leprosula TaxID=152421 RepID=A0AAV5JWB1_9ROSI|nr:hypothetical protein SLEP1_g27265 [Rubroshorea leprosula]
MAVPEAPLCYVGVACQFPAFRFMKQTGRMKKTMVVPEAPACYVGVGRRCLAFRFMKQTVQSLISVCELIFTCICV